MPEPLEHAREAWMHENAGADFPPAAELLAWWRSRRDDGVTVIARWKRLSCPHCGDIWSSDLNDDNPYECSLCGRTGVGVVTTLVREDQRVVDALLAAERYIERGSRISEDAAVRAKVKAALESLVGR